MELFRDLAQLAVVGLRDRRWRTPSMAAIASKVAPRRPSSKNWQSNRQPCSSGQTRIASLDMRLVAWLLTPLLLVALFGPVGGVCSAGTAIWANCCGTNCPASSRQGGSRCCHLSGKYSDAAPPAAVSPTIPLENEHFIFVRLTAPPITGFRTTRRGFDSRAIFDPLSLLCSRQI